ncbi:MAG: glycosyl transferase family 1, partial [Terriglobia bacterium]
MRRTLDDYRGLVDDEMLAAIERQVRGLYGKRLLHMNSTYQGGGVAEKLQSLIPLLNDVGVGTSWSVLHGTHDFFTVTKKFHNALQGESV